MTKYICIEGGEGSYKSTTVAELAEYYRLHGKKVLTTKEPGTSHLPITMELREMMLSNEYNDDLSALSRELISQAIRSIHLKKLIEPALNSGEYDYIIQDRGMLSGIVYALACGIDLQLLSDLYRGILEDSPVKYDQVFTLQNLNDGLNLAKSSKNEFEGGDAMESMGVQFHNKVNADFVKYTTNPDYLELDGFPNFCKKFYMVDVTDRGVMWIVRTIVKEVE